MFKLVPHCLKHRHNPPDRELQRKSTQCMARTCVRLSCTALRQNFILEEHYTITHERNYEQQEGYTCSMAALYIAATWSNQDFHTCRPPPDVSRQNFVTDQESFSLNQWRNTFLLFVQVRLSRSSVLFLPYTLSIFEVYTRMRSWPIESCM